MSQRVRWIALAALMAALVACQAPAWRNMPLQQQMPIQNWASAPIFQGFNAPIQLGDVMVKFNNAYHELYTDNEQAGHQDPHNPDKIFVGLVQQAKKSLDIAIYDITEVSIIQALIQARQRGVRVRIVTESDSLALNGQLRPQMQAMADAGIFLRGDERTGLMHHKFMIMDGQHVITSSMNLTHNSLYRDNNNALKISSPQLAANYQAEFDRLFEQGLFGPGGKDVPFPVVKVDGASIQTYFSPRGGTKQAILETLGRARQSIRFAVFSVTDKDIQQMLVRKAREGLAIEGIFDGCMISQYSIYQELLTKNIPVMIDGNQALLHSKTFIVDRRVVITGSYNFSMSAEERNNENTLIIQSPKIAAAYEQEHERLKRASVQNNPPPYDNRACSSQVIDDDINPI
ncbi:MAG: DUF1669 domain-containing protein [Candidatus Sericytochromatia bacterium]|nr:DUF1669 domain-containing protein [Candidatus Sericytochromatia bacterium]